jgi:hypothetical protein
MPTVQDGISSRWSGQLKPNLKMPLFESRNWLELKDCPGRSVSLAYANLQLGYTRLIRKGSTKIKEDGNTDLRLLAFSI